MTPDPKSSRPEPSAGGHRLLIDEMYGASVAHHLRSDGFDARHVRDVGLGGSNDSDVLAHAIDDDRILVTDNVRDFELLAAAQRESGDLVPILVVRRTGLGTGGGLHSRIAAVIARWCELTPDPYRDFHWPDPEA